MMPLPSNSEAFDNSVSYREAAYIGGIAIGIGCLGPVSVVGYVGAIAAGILGTGFFDGIFSIGTAAINPFYTKWTHRIGSALHLCKKTERHADQLEEAFRRVQSHPVYQALAEKKLIKENLTANECLYLGRSRLIGEGEITEMMSLIDSTPSLSSNALLESIDVESVFYHQMLHSLKLVADFAKAKKIIESTQLMYSDSPESVSKEIEQKEAEIKQFDELCRQVTAELYPYQVVNGSVFSHSCKHAFEELVHSQPKSSEFKGRLTLLTQSEWEADFNYHYRVVANRHLWINKGSYDVPENCPNLPEFRNSVNALTGRSIFFQHSPGLYRFYDPLGGVFEFVKEEDFFDALSVVKSRSDKAQFSIYLSDET